MKPTHGNERVASTCHNEESLDSNKDRQSQK